MSCVYGDSAGPLTGLCAVKKVLMQARPDILGNTTRPAPCNSGTRFSVEACRSCQEADVDVADDDDDEANEHAAASGLGSHALCLCSQLHSCQQLDTSRRLTEKNTYRSRDQFR